LECPLGHGASTSRSRAVSPASGPAFARWRTEARNERRVDDALPFAVTRTSVRERRDLADAILQRAARPLGCLRSRREERQANRCVVQRASTSPDYGSQPPPAVASQPAAPRPPDSTSGRTPCPRRRDPAGSPRTFSGLVERPGLRA
jgi:hypothetical protein